MARSGSASGSPQVVVVVSGWAGSGACLLDPVRGHVRRHGPLGLPVEMVGAALGADAGLAGAAGRTAAFRREVQVHG